jgi:hypothetical protein
MQQDILMTKGGLYFVQETIAFCDNIAYDADFIMQHIEKV